jgi:RHS repeat-associated protein
MNRDGVVYFLHADHLGSTSLATDDSGQEVDGSRTLYYPYGEQRWSASGGTLPTDFTYTGQRADSYTQLIHMGARWYDGYLGRWISPDTIVPEPGNPQDLNRYSYVRNSPLNFIDPSGHAMEQAGGGGLDEEGWYWFYYNNPQVYYADYWAAEEGQNITSLAMAYAYEQNVLHRFGTLNENIAPAMVARLNAEQVKENPDILVLLTCVGFVAALDADSIQYIDNTSRGWGLASPSGSGGGGGRTSGGANRRPVRAGEAGRYGDLRRRGRPAGSELVAHHMPQAALGWTSLDDGGALVISSGEHYQTRTYGWRGALTVNQDADLAFREVLAKDIWDVRSIASSRYNEGLLDLIDYYRINFPNLMKK